MTGATISTSLFITGALLEGWLAAMLLIAARALRATGARWPHWIAAGFAINALRSTVLACGYGQVALDAAPRVGTALLAVLMVGCITTGLIDYSGMSTRLARRTKTLALVGLAVLFGVEAFHLLNRWQGYVASSVFVVGWGVLMVQAMRREPRSGHGLVIAALLSFPAATAMSRVGMPFELLPLLEIVPLSALGMTVLTTGLVRAQRHAQREAAQAAIALAAREQAEAQLRAANETLEHRVAMRTAELHETIEGLESFNRSVSHDLRGPLGGIAGVAQLARDYVAEGNPAQADRMLAAIAAQADSSMQMVAALLALARAGDAQPRRAPVDVAALVDDVVAAQRQASPAAAVMVQSLPRVDADRDLLRQVFVNLVGNACKFAASATEPRVVVGHAPGPHGGAFFVRDNGVGFEAADSERLFKPFQRLHGVRFEGSGVGLSIVRRIVDHHGGRIWAEGAPGAGATFWFTLGPD